MFVPNFLPVVGLEPTTLTGRDFESRAYANSATPALSKYNYHHNLKIPLASTSSYGYNNVIKSMTENDLAILGSVFLIEVDKIKPNSQQPRTEFDLEKLKDLSESIRQYGVLQPLVVIRRETESDAGISVEYELIAGERRLRASKLAGLTQVPVVIRKESDEKTKLELAIIENLQREDLNAIDRAVAFKRLAENFKLKHHEIAVRMGKSREYVTNTMRLLMLPEEIQAGLIRGEVSEGHCRVILALDGRAEEQMALYKDIIEKKMSVRLTEKITRSIVRGSLSQEESANAEIKFIEKKLADTLGTKVQIEVMGGRGTISINFFSNEELNSFLNRMTKESENNVEIGAPAVKSIGGIIENKNAEAELTTIKPVVEKDFSGASTIDPVEELLKNFSL